VVLRRFALVVFFSAAVATAAFAQGAVTVPKPGSKDLCPVCGMLVSKYPHWAATIVYRNGHAHHFDGAKDLFKFWHDPGKYTAGHKREDMVALWVTDFYSLQPVDAKKAYYVVGSDVLGPMGHEFVPLISNEDASDFLKDHKGKRILTFDQIPRDLVFRVDDGKH
jgi:copper chaperone NosL